jgi:hypothetical protein
VVAPTGLAPWRHSLPTGSGVIRFPLDLADNFCWFKDELVVA